MCIRSSPIPLCLVHGKKYKVKICFVMYGPVCMFNCLLLSRHEIEVDYSRTKLPGTAFTWIWNYSLLRNLPSILIIPEFFLKSLLNSPYFFNIPHTHICYFKNSAKSWGLQLLWTRLETCSKCHLVSKVPVPFTCMYALFWLVKQTK